MKPPSLPSIAVLKPRVLLACGEVVLVGLLAVQSARLVWIVAAPDLPAPPPSSPTAPPADFSVLTRFDPFFRAAAAQVFAQTDQSFALFGVRADPSGGGSAIIAGPDGRQGSYAVGDEIAPGVKLGEVAGDHVVLDRSGARSRLHFPEAGATASAEEVQP